VAEITVRGGSLHQRALVKKAAECYLARLLPKRRIHLYDALVIDFELIPNLFEKEHCKGDCLSIYDDDSNSLDFEIRLDSSMNMIALLMGVAHEIVHVKQYATGELADTRNPHVSRWKGKRINWKKLDYFDHPWEIEAYGRECGLLELFVRSKPKLANTVWYNRDPDYL
jgi:hypothetical protein